MCNNIQNFFIPASKNLWDAEQTEETENSDTEEEND